MSILGLFPGKCEFIETFYMAVLKLKNTYDKMVANATVAGLKSLKEGDYASNQGHPKNICDR